MKILTFFGIFACYQFDFDLLLRGMGQVELPWIHKLKTTRKAKMSADSSRQIKQMVNFILQEAHEKANELKLKVCLIISVSIKI